MALLDFKKYLVQTQAQYLEMKADLTDYEQAFKDGHITEEQLADVKKDINNIEQNYQRLLYVAYLLELPRSGKKKEKHNKRNKSIIESFNQMHADKQYVIAENKSALDDLRKELKKLKNKDTE